MIRIRRATEWWWSHILWLFVRHDTKQRDTLYRRYIPDLTSDPLLRFFERTCMLWLVVFAALMFILGGWPLLLWSVCDRIVIGYPANAKPRYVYCFLKTRK